MKFLFLFGFLGIFFGVLGAFIEYYGFFTPFRYVLYGSVVSLTTTELYAFLKNCEVDS